jgi:signal transduction histidine kinase
MELTKQRVDMTALARDVTADLVRDEPSRGEHITIESLPEALGDPRLLRQVLTNLLSNALKFSRNAEPPEIVVTGSRDNGVTRYAVRDNGVGYDPSYRDKLFGIFQRLHPATEFAGTGIGLAIVDRIVKRHGGVASSDGTPGQGAVFRFEIPAD